MIFLKESPLGQKIKGLSPSSPKWARDCYTELLNSLGSPAKAVKQLTRSPFFKGEWVLKD